MKADKLITTGGKTCRGEIGNVNCFSSPEYEKKGYKGVRKKELKF